MNITYLDHAMFQIELSKSEMIMLNNCLNEARSAVSDREFQTRVGVTKKEVEQALQLIHGSISKAL